MAAGELVRRVTARAAVCQVDSVQVELYLPERVYLGEPLTGRYVVTTGEGHQHVVQIYGEIRFSDPSEDGVPVLVPIYPADRTAVPATSQLQSDLPFSLELPAQVQAGWNGMVVVGVRGRSFWRRGRLYSAFKILPARAVVETAYRLAVITGLTHLEWRQGTRKYGVTARLKPVGGRHPRLASADVELLQTPFGVFGAITLALGAPAKGTRLLPQHGNERIRIQFRFPAEDVEGGLRPLEAQLRPYVSEQGDLPLPSAPPPADAGTLPLPAESRPPHQGGLPLPSSAPQRDREVPG